MLLPISLLKNYLDVDLPIHKIITILTNLGIEVESVKNEKPAFSHVVIAEVKNFEKHPEADKLKIAEVFDGRQTYQVVCGAENCKPGLKTAFAKIGAEITDEKSGKVFKIKKAKLRGVESFGMLCAADELGLGADHSGILEIKSDLPLGADLAIYFHDPILELSLTPNLGHCLSVIGIARELAAGINGKVKYPEDNFSASKNLSTKSKVQIELKDNRCLRYSGLYIENVSVGPSPEWLSTALEKSGFKSINNLVDITNFIMLEMGQPMHAFDLAKIEKAKISIEKSNQELSFVGLNQIEYKVPKNTILIKDAKTVLALGGILGSEHSSVSDSTNSIFLESACFDPVSIRRTCNSLALRTESSQRFEKASDPDATVSALKRAAFLIQKICPEARIAEDLIDIKTREFPEKAIFLSEEKTRRILGTELSLNEISSLLNRLEMEVSVKKDKQLHVRVPSYRNDIKAEIDLIEEVARIYGYNNINKHKAYFTSSFQKSSVFHLFEQQLKKNLIAQGLKEIITPDLVSFKLANMTHEKEISTSSILAVKKAKSQDNSMLRPSLLPSHLQIIKHNHDHKNFYLNFFETSKIHLKKEKIIEEPVLAITISGNKVQKHFSEKEQELDFLDLKGFLENLLASLNIYDFEFQKTDNSPSFHPGQQAHLLIEGIKVATLGSVHPKLLQKMDLKKNVFFAEVNTHLLLSFKQDKAIHMPLPEFPATERDWTLSWKSNMPISSLFKEIEKLRPYILEDFYLLDLYQDPQKSNSSNITLRFIYRDLKKTISFEEAQKAHTKITDAMNKKFLST